jgi:hypothetical protein
MKVTKRQLRRIIKEEKTKIIREMNADGRTQEQELAIGRNQNVMDKLHSAIDALIEAVGNEEALMELQGIVDEWDPETYGAPTRGDPFTDERR